MKTLRPRHVLAFLLLGLGATGTVMAADPEADFFPYPYSEQKLDNGLTTIVVPMPSPGLASLWIIVRTGSRDEYEPGKTGFAHFFEHMMFRGTKRFPAEAYNRFITEIGANINAFTSDDLTAYHMAITVEDLERALDVEADRFQNLDYPPELFRTEAGAVFGEYRKNRTNPFFLLSEALSQTAFEVHTYGHTTMGYRADIEAMPELYDYSRTFFHRYYRPDNAIVLVCGDVEAEPTRQLIERYFGGWEAGYQPPQIKPEPEQTEERHVEVTYEGRALPTLWLAYKFAAFDPQDTVQAAAHLLAELAFGETSELSRRLVLDEQIVELLAANPNINRDPGRFDIIATVKDKTKVDYVLEQIDSTIEQFQSQLPDDKALANARDRARYEFLMALDTPDGVASALARLLAVGGSMTAIETAYGTLANVEGANVQAAAQRYFDKERRTVAKLWEATR